MPPAARKHCDFPGCASGEPDEEGQRGSYTTPEGLATRAEVNTDLMQHVEIAPTLPLKMLEAQRDAHKAEAELRKAEAAKIREERGTLEEPTPATHAPTRTGPKVEPIPRPTIDKGMTESDSSFFTNQWDRYILGTGLTGDTVALQLWAACTTTLQKSLHNGGAGHITDRKQLLDVIKSLAVERRNSLVNIVELQGMGQHRDEKVNTYTARLNSKANLCDLTTECKNCEAEVSFNLSAG